MITGIKLFIFMAALFGIVYIIGIISNSLASIISKKYKFEIALMITIFFICMTVGILSECMGSGIK